MMGFQAKIFSAPHFWKCFPKSRKVISALYASKTLTVSGASILRAVYTVRCSEELYYVFDFAGDGGHGVLVQEEYLEFDEHGMCRISSGRAPFGDYIVVITRDGDGDLMGMVFTYPIFEP